MEKNSDDKNQILSDKIDEPVEIHEAFRLKEYFDILKSKKPVREIQENNTSNEEAFKKFEDLIKTAKYRKHES